MNKKVIRMTESDLHNIVKESVGKIINEVDHNYGLTKGVKDPDYVSGEYSQETAVKNDVSNEIEYNAQRIENYLKKNLDSPYGWKPWFKVVIDAAADTYGDKSRISIHFKPQYGGDLLAIAKALLVIDKMPGHYRGGHVSIKCDKGELIATIWGFPEDKAKSGRNITTVFGRNTDRNLQMPRERKGKESHGMGMEWYPSN